MLKAEKEVSNKEPKLGEEVEYRISFKNTVENGKLAEVKIEDQLPDGLEYVKDSVKAKGNRSKSREWKVNCEVRKYYRYKRKKHYF